MDLEKRPLDTTDCGATPDLVPAILHGVSKHETVPLTFSKALLGNPSFRSNYRSDKNASTYVLEECGVEAQAAYECLKVPLRSIYRSCANVSLGYDYPVFGEAYQMKILASVPKHPIMRCMVDSIVHNVKTRFRSINALLISGPSLLHRCGQRVGVRDVAITYMDTHSAAWPYTGMRTREKLLAFEEPNIKRHWEGQDGNDYGSFHNLMSPYTRSCRI